MRLYYDHSFVPSSHARSSIIIPPKQANNQTGMSTSPHDRYPVCAKSLHVANLLLEIFEFLLCGSVLLGHLLKLSLPLITVLLESLDFALEVTSFNIGLTEPINVSKSIGGTAR